MTRQEYLIIDLLMSFYPKFTTQEMFSRSASIRRSPFMAVPDCSVYMSYRRYCILNANLSFITSEQTSILGITITDTFWEVQPMIDTFNHCRAKHFSPGWRLVVDESMFEWRGKDQRYGKDGCPHTSPRLFENPRELAWK